MDGEEDREILLARTSSKPADTTDQEIILDQKPTRAEETNRSKRRSILYGLDRSLDDLELDEDDDQERKPPRRDADYPRRKRKQIPVVNDASGAHDSNEPDSCRICSFPAEPDNLLYHPCKCSGTIKYVHQDCLKSWLDTSRRTRCDVCHHLYTFKKVYSSDMPSTLPVRILVGPMLKHTAKWARIALRVLFVGTIWLAVLPAITYWCWRVGFWLSDYVSLRVSGQLYYLELYSAQLRNISDLDPNFVMPSTSFSSSLSESLLQVPTESLTAAPSVTSAQDPLVSAFESLQSIIQQQPTGTNIPTPHPSSSAIASAFSQLASVLQAGNYISRRTPRFKPRRTFPDGRPMTTVLDVFKKAVLFITGKPLFEQDSSLWLDILLLPYHTCARLGSWIIYIPQLLYKNSIGFLLTSTYSNNSTTSSLQRFIEDMSVPIVSGQIIAICIVIAFVALFFLREWVLANAEGMFGNEQRAADAQRNGQDGAQNGAANPARDDIPGAFPQDAPRIDELDIDMGFAEPRPPSPNIISLEEQEVLMKEVIERREMRDRELSKKGEVVQKWQWGKREEILEGWREHKKQELQLTGRVSTPKPELPVQSESALEQERAFDGNDTEIESEVHWERFRYGDMDPQPDGGVAVEHIEHSPIGDSAEQGASRPLSEDLVTAISATTLVIEPTKTISLVSPEHPIDARTATSSSAYGGVPLIEALEIDDTSFLPDDHSSPPTEPSRLPRATLSITNLKPASTTVSEPSSSPFSLFSKTTNSTNLASDKEKIEDSTTKPSHSSSPQLSSPSQDEERTKNKDVIEMTSEESSVFPDYRSKLPSMVQDPIRKTPPSVFATLVPPTPPSMRPTELPFSIRGYNVGQSRLWSQRRAESSTSTSSHELDTKASSRPVWPAEPSVERPNSTPDFNPGASGSEVFRPKSRTTFTQLSAPRSRPHGKWPSPKQSRRFSPSRSPKSIISPIPRRPSGAHDMPPSNEQNIQSPHTADRSYNPYAHPAALYFVDPSLIPSSAPALVSTEPGSENSAFMSSPSRTGSLSAPLSRQFYPGSISAPITPGEKAWLRQSPDLMSHFEAMTPAASQTGGKPFSFPFAFLPESQGHRLSSSVDGVHGPPEITSRSVGPPLPMYAFDRTGSTMPRGHRMNMGMGSVIDLPTQSGGRAHRLPRSRALTAGGDREFMRRQTGLKRDALITSHQRSSSLSHASNSNYFRSDDNQLLDHERRQASPIPWYGFPDPRPELERERKKLKEWEQTEMRRIYVPQSYKRVEKSVALVQGMSRQESKSTAPQRPVNSLTLGPIQISGEKSTSSGVEETIIPRSVEDTHSTANMKGMAQISAPGFDDCGVELNKVSSSKSEYTEKSLLHTLAPISPAHDQKADVEPIDEAGSMSSPEPSRVDPVGGGAYQQFDISLSHNIRPDTIPLVNNHRDTTAFSNPMPPTSVDGLARIAPTASSSAVLSTSRLRAPAPGSITLPSQPTNFEETMRSLKRPGLPLATSPISVDDRSPATMALYQAPEELHSQMQEGQQAMAAGSSIKALDINPMLFQIPVELPEPPEPEAVRDNADVNDVDQDLQPDNDDGAGIGDAAAPAEDVWEDDWAHMLEVVGIVGPWYHIVQNAALVMVIFNVTLGVGVFLPYVMGRTTSLVVVEPSAILQRLSLLNDNPSFLGLQFPPLWTSERSISIIGKGFSYVFGDLVSSLSHTANATLGLLGSTWKVAPNQTINPQDISNVPIPHPFDMVYRIWSTIRPTAIISNGFDSILHAIRWYQQKSACTMGSSTSSSFGNILAFVDYAICSFYPDVIKTSPEFRTVLRHWLRYIFQLVATERISAIIFGYMVTLCGLALHSTLSTQHGPYMVFTLLKVGSFVILETIGRPLAFGFAIDLFTLSLFPNTTIQSRLAFLRIAPYSSLLQHWLIGNVVIIQFVRALDDLHRFLRPGAMWHVRHLVDPSPPSIRDLITKSIPWHITKLFATISSGVCLLWLLLGLVLDLNNFLTSNFAPLRWNLRQPSSDVPLDLVLLNIFIPATFRFLKLKKLCWTMAKTFIVEWSKYLNLQNVLFDEIAVPAPIDTTDGTFWRVPVTAGAIQLAGKPYAIETDVTGNGITQEGRDLIDLQLLASEKAMRNPNHDYRVIFYPHNFQARLAAFVIISWFAFFGAVWTAVTLPICMGRLAFKHLLHTTAVHDAHSWMAGLYIFWFANFGRYLVAREIRRWSKYLAEPNHRFTVGLFLTHTMTMLGRLSFAVIVLIFILPTLIGLLVEVYFVLPLWYHFYPGTTPTLRVVDAWVAGLTICALILRAARLGRPGRLLTLFDRIRRDGWFKIKTRALVSQLTLIAIALMALILSPFILELILPGHIARDLGAGHVVLKVFLPMLFSLFISSLLATTLHGMLVLWVETVRDEKFLIREIIENFEVTSIESTLTDDHDAIVP